MKNKTLAQCTVLALCLGGYSSSFAAPQSYDALLNTLTKPPVIYVGKDEDYKIDPRLLKNEYVVDWAIRPQFNLNPDELETYKRPLSVELTVIASSGNIVKSSVVKSSGSKNIDAKVVQALKSARLEAIPFVDPNVTYVLVQNFTMKDPL